jgi:hypothetical protein
MHAGVRQVALEIGEMIDENVGAGPSLNLLDRSIRTEKSCTHPDSIIKRSSIGERGKKEGRL